MSDPKETESEQETVVEIESETEHETESETESEADHDVQYEPSSETVEGMDDDFTVTETTQLNEDNYYQTSDQHLDQEINEDHSDHIIASSSNF